MAGSRKLTDLNISGIRYLHSVEGVSLRKIAKVYGVSHIQIYRIIKGLQRNKKNEPK